MRFEGKVALVTGGARGIGAATAARFAEEGAKVAVTDLSFDGEGPALQIACDVTKRDEVEAAVAQTVSELGGLDILVTCAGVIRDNLLHKMTDDDWETVIDHPPPRDVPLGAGGAGAHGRAEVGEDGAHLLDVRAWQPRPDELRGGEGRHPGHGEDARHRARARSTSTSTASLRASRSRR